jgi:AcrR family transcriptional regulator
VKSEPQATVPPDPGALARRQRRHGVESRMRILQATFELAREFGYQGTSISKVVERSGLPASSVYWHFADKDALFAAMIQHSFDRWSASMPKWSLPAEGGGRRDAVAARVRSAIESIATGPEFWQLGLLLSLARQPAERQARRQFQEIRARVVRDMITFWNHVLPPDLARRTPDRPALLAQITMAAVDGLFVSAQIDSGYDYQALAGLLADMLDAVALKRD